MLLTALLLAGLIEAPLSLTTSDGSGLRLVSLSADAVCGGPVCFTELRLAFENPEDRVIEGQFHIALPTGASVSRFAMKIEDRWQEAEVVEKQAARRAYEDFLHRRQDPALLEQAAGNQFQARVFPIPARGRKELVIGYGHALPSTSAPYVLPLAGLPQIEKLTVRVRDAEGKVVLSMDKQRFVPNADAVALVPGARVVRSEDVVVLRASPSFPNAAEPGDGPIMVLVDTSASRALQLRKDAELVAALLRELAKASPSRQVQVVAFDQTRELIYGGTLAAYDGQRLLKRRALGATDLALALAHAAHTAVSGKNIERVIVITDGVATAELNGSVANSLRLLTGRGTQRIDAIVRGGVRDEAALAAIVRGGAREGMVIDGDASIEAIARRLQRVARSGIAVDVANATWVWPKTLDGVQPGDERVIVAELKAGTTLSLKLGGSAIALDAAREAPAPLLRRAWAEAKIARAQAMLAATTSEGSRKEIKEQIVAISTKHRVLSSETALLVLESEADFERYGIQRNALTDILTVTDAGIGLLSRKDVVVAVKPASPPIAKAKPSREKAKQEESDESKLSKDSREGEGEAQGADDLEEEKPSPDKSDDAPGAPSPPPPPSPTTAPMRAPRMDAPAVEAQPSESRAHGGAVAADAAPAFVNPWTGPFDIGMKLLRAGKRAEALQAARAWREEQPGDVLALLLLAEVLADSDVEEAARALGAIIDLYPKRTDLRRAVGARLDQLVAARAAAGAPAASVAGALAVDTWRQSVEQRPDHPQSHRGLAWALVRQGKYAEAFAVSEQALTQRYRSDGYRGVDRILREDLGLIGAAWRAHGGPVDVERRVKKAGGVVPSGPSLRFVLWWETDSNDVDFHIRDGKGNHAFFSAPQLASGGALYADVTTGYGPECFTIEGKQRTFPYALSAHYYSRGPMGFGLGTMMVIQHDGKGAFTFMDRPFVIMVDGAFVDLGTVAQ